MKLRLSVTQLEAYRCWLENEEASVEEMVAYLESKTEPSPSMLAGSAFHKVLESAQNIPLEYVEQDGFRFDFRELDDELALPAIKEFKFYAQREIEDVIVTFVGVIDALDSQAVYDHKLTSVINLDRYENSMQWRAYLYFLSMPTFTYNLFRKYQPVAEPDLIILKELLQVSFHAYPEMEADILELTAQLIEFIKQHAPHLIREM